MIQTLNMTLSILTRIVQGVNLFVINKFSNKSTEGVTMLCGHNSHPFPPSRPLYRAWLTNLLALIIFSVGSATSAQANNNWVTVTEYHGVTYYLDVANLVKADGRLRANLLSNYPFEQTVSSGSYKSEVEYYSIDCAQKGFELLHLEYYVENFAKGRLTFSNYANSDGKLNSPSGIPIMESFINMACSMPPSPQEIKASIARDKGTWITTAETDTAKFYVDIARLKKVGTRLLAFGMMDQKIKDKTASGKTYMSSVAYYSVDCAQRGEALKAVYYYENNFGQGKIVDSLNLQTEELQFPPPNSVGESFIQTACLLNVTKTNQKKPTHSHRKAKTKSQPDEGAPF